MTLNGPGRGIYDRLFMRMPRSWRLALGRLRCFYWGVVRSEPAQRRSIVAAEIAWCGKGLNPDELDELIAEQRPAWRRKSYPWHRWLYGDGER